ncbi:MAG: metallophosphoesterase [Planctomycetota bacterium]
MLSFVHAADLHLDSPFSSLGRCDEALAGLLKEATFQAYQNLIALCIRRRADFLLVAGDVYDGADRSLRAQLQFRDGLQELAQAGIRAYVAHGNHDPLDGWISTIAWPENAHVFGPEVETVPFLKDGSPCALIQGVSFPRSDVRENLARRFRAAESGLFQIGLLHCNVGANTGHEPYAPCTMEDLARAGLDYWALGHVHARRALSAESPAAVYPGNPQGRHRNESGPRGCCFVEVRADHTVKTEFVPLDAVRWSEAAVSVEGLSSEEELLRALMDCLEGVSQGAGGRPSLLRLTIEGRGALHAALRREGHEADLREHLHGKGRALAPWVGIAGLLLKTRPAVDPAARREAQDFVGDCLRLLQAAREDPVGAAWVRQALNPLYNDAEIGKMLREKRLRAPEGEALQALLDEAETLTLDLLLGEEGS